MSAPGDEKNNVSFFDREGITGGAMEYHTPYVRRFHLKTAPPSFLNPTSGRCLLALLVP